MNKKSFSSSILAFVLAYSIFIAAALPSATLRAQTVGTQTAGTAALSTDLEKRLARIEAQVEERRKELGIPGLSLAIVKDGKIIYAKGLGYKDFEKKIPATADTQFAIGSATKAFTALSVLMLQDAGKLSIDDSPKKYLPYFKINNPETDKKIQIRDLLAHSSGLNRTDLAMITGKLNRVELIKIAGEAKPMADLREKFFYQNIMFAAAGEIVAEVSGQPWEKFVPEKILKPLGMTNTTMSVAEMQKSKDFSFGYSYNFDTKQTRKLPTRDILQVAPAGSINSSANDMAKWLQFVLSEGKLGGKRFISEKSFEEWTKPQMKISPDGKVAYGLGWFLQDWKGKRVVQHGGNIDGFNSMVAMIPEEKIGFAMLTNVSASSLGNELMQIVWSGILEDINEAPVSEAAKKEIGKYRFAQAGFDIEIKVEDEKLVAIVPNQPTYVLQNIEGRKYKLSNAPEGFFITFKDGEAFLEQPHGNFILPKVGAEKKDESETDDSAKELIGRYASEQNEENTIEIKDVEGKTSLVVGMQPPYPLVKKTENEFKPLNLPEGFSVKVKRGADKKIAGITLVQPNGEFAFKYIGETEKNVKPAISTDELMTKMITALGGAENLRKINSRVMNFDLDFVHQGLKAKGVSFIKAPNKATSEITVKAFGRTIATIREYFNGNAGGEIYSFAPDEQYTGQRLEDVKLGHDLHALLDWKDKYEKVKIEKVDKIGDEEVYVVSLEPKKASRKTMFVSTETFLPVREISIVVSSTSSQKIPVTQNFEDYREVDGVMIPFKVIGNNPGMGEIITYVKEIKHNVKISDDKFKK